MAIYFNGKILEPKENGTSLERKYFKELKEIKEVFDRFRRPGQKEASIVLTRDFPKIYNDKKTSYKPAPPIAVPMNVHTYNEELGSIEVRYSKRPPIASGNKLVWPTSSEDSIIHEKLGISEQRLDFAWFMLKASDYVQKGILKIMDKQAEYSGTFGEIQKQMKASAAMFNDTVSLERLEALAELVLPKKLKVTADSKEEFAAKLWALVSTGEKERLSYNYDAVIAADKKISSANVEGGVGETLIVLENGEEIVAKMKKCPPTTKDETLRDRAAAVGVPVGGLSRDELWTAIRLKEEEGK